MNGKKRYSSFDKRAVDARRQAEGLSPRQGYGGKKRRVNMVGRLSFLNVLVVGALFVIISVLLLVLKRPDISELEKRPLAKFPTWTVQTFFSGKYTDDISEYYNDTVPGRDTFKKITSNLQSLKGLRLGDIKIYSGTGPQGAEVKPETSGADSSGKPSSVPESSPESTSSTLESEAGSEASSSKPEENSSKPEESGAPESNAEAEGKLSDNGAILIVKDRAMEMFGGSYEVAEAYADTLNAFQQDLGGGATVYEMTVPVAVAYYVPSNYADLTSDPKNFIDYIEDLLSGGTQHVDIYSKLLEHKDEDIYFRTDHHWTSLGAYYAAGVFAKQAGVPFPELSAYEKEVTEGYVGTMYAFTQDSVLLNNPEDFVAYKPQNDYHVKYFDPDYEELDRGDTLFFPANLSDMYASVMGSDQVITEIKTDVKNGRKLAVFKDSYGNALVPFLVNSFEEIYVIDMRYFNLNAVDYLKEKGATDVLFADCVFTACGYNMAEEIRTQ